MFYHTFNSLIYFFKLLFILLTWLLNWWADIRSFIVSVFQWLIFHLYGDIIFFEKGMSGIVNSILDLPKTAEFEKIILQDLCSLFLHIYLFCIPVAKLAKINPTFSFRIFIKRKNILTIWTRKTKSAFTAFNCVLRNSFTCSTLIWIKFRNSTIVAAICRTIKTCIDFFLKYRSITLTLHFDKRFILLRQMNPMNTSFCQGVHWVIIIQTRSINLISVVHKSNNHKLLKSHLKIWIFSCWHSW